MRRAEVRIVQNQTEEVTGERELSQEETKAFLYKNYPDLYKQLYPDQVIENKPEPRLVPKPHQKREGQDIQKSNKTYVFNKYGSEQVGQGTDFSYRIEIKTDMDIRRD